MSNKLRIVEKFSHDCWQITRMSNLKKGDVFRFQDNPYEEWICISDGKSHPGPETATVEVDPHFTIEDGDKYHGLYNISLAEKSGIEAANEAMKEGYLHCSYLPDSIPYKAFWHAYYEQLEKNLKKVTKNENRRNWKLGSCWRSCVLWLSKTWTRCKAIRFKT